jgi:hypothetical protein
MSNDKPSTQNVAVIVLDDFGNFTHDGKRVSCSYEVCDNDTNCVVKPDGQTYATKGVLLGTAGLPHGLLVYRDLYTALVSEMSRDADQKFYGYSAIDWKINWVRNVSVWHGEHKLMLIGIDTESFRTGYIASRLESIIAYLRLRGYEHFVVNMSFAIVPCEYTRIYDQIVNSDQELGSLIEIFVQNFSQDQTGTLLAKFEEFGGFGVPSSIAKTLLSELVYNPDSPFPLNLGNDPLRLMLCDPKREYAIYPVGAAGNWPREDGEPGFPHPFAPAKFDEVMSVGSANEAGNDPPFAKYSNPAEVVMEGRAADMEDACGEPLRGTSFAAAKFSAKAAIYLFLGGDEVHDPGGVNQVIPSLGYADDNGPWDNMPYDILKDDAAKGGNIAGGDVLWK